jgi:hypothetical protein
VTYVQNARVATSAAAAVATVQTALSCILFVRVLLLFLLIRANFVIGIGAVNCASK